MAINLQPSKISLDQNSGKVVIEYLPYDSDTQSFSRPFGFSKKVELPASELLSSIKEALVQFGVDKQNVTPENPDAQPTPEQLVIAKIAYLRKTSTLIVDEFIKENILLGIEQRGLTEQVLNVSTPVLNALQGLAIKVAVQRLKEIDPQSFDGVILNAERLLKFRNKMEAMIGVPLATEWNQAPTW